jgi:acyl carrier protein
MRPRCRSRGTHAPRRSSPGCRSSARSAPRCHPPAAGPATCATGGRTPLIEAYLREEIARILRLDPLSLEDTAPLATFGLDSLTGMELRDRVTADLAVAIPMTTFVRGPSLRELAAAIGIELRTAEEGSARDSTDGDAVPNAGAVAPDLVPRVDDLSEAEIDSLLADLMSNPSNRPSSGEAP